MSEKTIKKITSVTAIIMAISALITIAGGYINLTAQVNIADTKKEVAEQKIEINNLKINVTKVDTAQSNLSKTVSTNSNRVTVIEQRMILQDTLFNQIRCGQAEIKQEIRDLGNELKQHRLESSRVSK